VIARCIREIWPSPEAFHRAIADLAGLRSGRLLPSGIAARREIARRVAHEIQKSSGADPRGR